MSSVTRTVSTLLAGWLLLTAVGCATLNLPNVDLRSRKATARNPAVRVVCLWEPAEGRDPNGVPCTGFAGQILFLTNTSLPVSVDGDVRIYLFDNHGKPEEQTKPLHQFDFDSGSWSRHYTYGTLGPAYNVFVPYMRHGVYDATCALRIRLTPKNGPVVFSEMTSIELLGFGGDKATRKGPVTDPRVEATSPEDLTATNNRRKTTTISLNLKNGTAGEATEVAVETTTPGTIQQAAFQVEATGDPAPLSEADARLIQLEQMVQELRALQAAQPLPPARRPTTVAPVAPAPANPAPVNAMPPRRLDDEDAPVRIRVRAAAPAARQPQEANDSGVRKVSRTVVEQRRPHPLDDDAPAAQPPARHPLDEADDAPVARKPASTRSTSRRHPLEDDDEPPKKPATKKVIPAAQSPAQQDPFDPIDTEATDK